MTRTNRAALTAAALLSCTLAFSGCSLIEAATPGGTEEKSAQEDDGSGQEADTGTSEESSDSSESAAASGTDDASGATEASSSGEQAEVSLGEDIKDPDMEDEIEVISAVRNFESEDQAEMIEQGGEVVLLKVKVTPGQKFGGLVSMGDFKISFDDGAEYWNNRTRTIEDEMDEAGFTPFDDVSRRDGGTHEGWIAFFPSEKADTYKLQYLRDAAKVIGSDEKIDEFEQVFDIPAAG